MSNRIFHAVLREYGSAAIYSQLFQLRQASLAFTLRESDGIYPPIYTDSEYKELLKIYRSEGRPLDSELTTLTDVSPQVTSFFSAVTELQKQLLYQFFEKHKDTNTDDGQKRALKDIREIVRKFELANEVLEKIELTFENGELSLIDNTLQEELIVVTRRWRIHA